MHSLAGHNDVNYDIARDMTAAGCSQPLQVLAKDNLASPAGTLACVKPEEASFA